jgi:type IV secretion system protein VirD4
MNLPKKLRFKTATYNPLDFISKESPTAIDDCLSLANALVVRPPGGDQKDRHWDDSAEGGIAGLAALTVYYGRPGTKSLQDVDQIVNSKERLDMAMKLMSEPDDRGEYPWGGMLARLGGRMQLWQSDEKGSVLSTMARHLQFLRTPTIAANTRSTSFDPSRLVWGKMAVFIVPSLQQGQTLIPWVRMIIDGMLKAVMRCGLQERRKTHFIIDEAASLGPMDALRDALNKGAGYGMRCQFYYQDAGALNRNWPNGEAQSLLAQTGQIYFSVNDFDTASLISNRIGDVTIMVESGGWSRGGSRSRSQGRDYTETGGTSWNESSNWNQMARRILKPEEIMALSPRTAITFPGGGMPPVMTTLIRWFEEPWLLKRRGWLRRQWEAFGVLVGSLLFLIIMILTAYCLSEAAKDWGSFERMNRMIQSMQKGGVR